MFSSLYSPFYEPTTFKSFGVNYYAFFTYVMYGFKYAVHFLLRNWSTLSWKPLIFLGIKGVWGFISYLCFRKHALLLWMHTSLIAMVNRVLELCWFNLWCLLACLRLCYTFEWSERNKSSFTTLVLSNRYYSNKNMEIPWLRVTRNCS